MQKEIKWEESMNWKGGKVIGGPNRSFVVEGSSRLPEVGLGSDGGTPSGSYRVRSSFVLTPLSVGVCSVVT